FRVCFRTKASNSSHSHFVALRRFIVLRCVASCASVRPTPRDATQRKRNRQDGSGLSQRTPIFATPRARRRCGDVRSGQSVPLSYRSGVMNRSVLLLSHVALLGGLALALAQAQPPAPPKLADGVYAVRRDSLTEKDVMPLKDGEALAVDHHRYLKPGQSEPPR